MQRNDSFDVITLGSAARDISFVTKRGKLIPDPSGAEEKLLAFTLGAKVSIEHAQFHTGGGACNAAVSFARLGLKVAPYLNVGKDELGEQIMLELIQEGADTKFVQMDDELQTGLAVILIPEGAGDRTVLFYSGANRNLNVRNWDELENTSWFYMGPISREAPELHERVINFAHSKSIKIANNPGLGQIERGFEYMAPLLQKLDVLMVNRTEAILLLKSKDPSLDVSDSKLERLAVELKKMGPNIVVVTCGSSGSCATDGENVYLQEPVETKVVDTTGAGDSFGSTFVASLVLGHDIGTAMLMASINAASVISQIGAQEGLLHLNEIRKKIMQRGSRAGF